MKVKKNASACADELVKLGYTICTGGTENHLLLWWVLLFIVAAAIACCCLAFQRSFSYLLVRLRGGWAGMCERGSVKRTGR